MNNNKGMPSILGDTPAPFSGPKPGHTQDFDNTFLEWQTKPGPETNTKLLKTVQPIIDTAVQSYAGNNASPTIRSRAKLMALKAMNNFDPQRGNIKTHLLSQLQSLRRLTAQSQNIISIPEQVGLDYQRLNDAENTMRDEMGRDPTDDELADYTNLSQRRIQKIRAFNQPVAGGSTDQVGGDDEFGGDPASIIPGKQNTLKAWENFVYEDLTPTDKIIMDHLLGRNNRRRLSTQQIAEKLRITPGAVSQRAAKIQSMIDRRFDVGGF
jgi:DNA-directed RNA polymerase specialized sigma subunit